MSWIREDAPVRLKMAELLECLEILGEGRRRAGKWPEGSDVRIAGLILAVLRFSRPDGAPSMNWGDLAPTHPAVWNSADWAGWYRGTGIGKVLDWWFGSGRKEQASPPLPAWSSSDRVLAILRADWRAAGDFLAVDHRDLGSPCRFELFGGGRSWLGPHWSIPEAGEYTSRPKPRLWITLSTADLAEWSYGAQQCRVTRSAMLMRGRRLALMSVLVEGRGPPPTAGWTMRLSLPPAVSATPLKDSPGLAPGGTEPTGHRAGAADRIALPPLLD